MDNSILLISDLAFEYKLGPKIHFPNFEMKAGEHSLLLGDSGSGKSTLLNLIAGFSKPLQGEVRIQHQSIYQLQGSGRDKFRAQQIGFIFQEAHFLKNLTVMENIQLAQSLAGFETDKEAIERLLNYLQIGAKKKAFPHELSRGQLQRVAIARALINKPALLIADEPTASLDDNNTTLVLNLLLDTAQQYGSTLLIATHDKRVKDSFSNTIQLNNLQR